MKTGAEFEAVLRDWRKLYLTCESGPYREFVKVPLGTFDKVLRGLANAGVTVPPRQSSSTKP